MNTRLGKSFGLAFMVAVGILALMFALGTFSAQQAGAAAIGDSVSLAVDDTTPGEEDVEVTVKYTDDAALSGATPDPDQIVVVLTGFITNTGDVNSATVSGTDSEGEPVEEFALDTDDVNTIVTPEVPATDDDAAVPSYATVTITLPADIDTTADGDQPLTFKDDKEITLVFAAGFDNPGVATTATPR